jgi:hypothetical protein
MPVIINIQNAELNCNNLWTQAIEQDGIIKNEDGTLSVYIKNENNVVVPYVITKFCCDILRDLQNDDTIYFDLDSQKCRYSTNTCGNLPVKIDVNSNLNDGTVFQYNSNESCILSIDFDYLFKVNCESLSKIILNTTKGTSLQGCTRPVDVFQNLDVSLVLEVYSGTSWINLYEESVFLPIGEDNLYNYLVDRPNSSGFYVCGQAATSETWATGCVPLTYLEFVQETQNLAVDAQSNVLVCNNIKQNLYDELFRQSGYSGLTAGETTFRQSLYSTVFSSDWLRYTTTITDETLLQTINNKKIRFSLKLNTYCGDICVLMDNISMNKNCDKLMRTDVFISRSPGFDLQKVVDNKKSWVNTNSVVNKNFEILTVSDTNPIRVTDYDSNDERLVINTKEIDLDISVASAIEYDVWKYLEDNTCTLTGLTFTACTTPPRTCGDKINFTGLMSTDITTIRSADEFHEVILSELIDVKNRKTIQSYPTLKALYERYLKVSGYCGPQSSMYRYDTMEDIANLVGSYWVDIIEQVIPSTSIWNGARIYTNTAFDQQKFRYRPYSSFFGYTSITTRPFNGYNVPSPINGTSGTTQLVSVTTKTITNNNTTTTKFSRMGLAQFNRGSEFIGKVTITP